MPPLATILMTARNARRTIQRATQSALEQGDYPFVLVDDFSSDDTVSACRAIAGDRLRVVRPPRHETLGLARQTGLSAVDTRFAVWVDADDEMLPGRVTRLVNAMRTDCSQIAADAVELMDGATGVRSGQLPMPPFLSGHHPAARLFERNYLPGTGCIGLETESALRVGYDPALHGPEDIDFILRSIVAGFRISFLDEVGYRLYAYPDSVSRQRDHQRRHYRAALLKHPYESVRTIYRRAGQSARITVWGLVSVAVFREDWAAALSYLDEAAAAIADPLEVLESSGPCPRPEGWRLLFHRGTVLLLSDRVEAAARTLEDAECVHASPEGANNLGVAMARLGNTQRAAELFSRSLRVMPGFLDARLNIEGNVVGQVTTHPLRAIPNRSDYSR